MCPVSKKGNGCASIEIKFTAHLGQASQTSQGMQENRALMVGGAAEMMIRLCSGRTKHQADSRRAVVRLFTQPVLDRMD